MSTAAKNLATTLLHLSLAVGGRKLVGLMAGPFCDLIIARIRQARQHFDRVVARLASGTYRPRAFAPRASPRRPAPRRPDPLPHAYGWLLRLVPESAGYRSQLENLFRDPEMIALMAQAPAPMARALRPLCWMLRITPPPLLPGRRRAAPRAAPTVAPLATPIAAPTAASLATVPPPRKPAAPAPRPASRPARLGRGPRTA